jgi:hypothetical protein
MQQLLFDYEPFCPIAFYQSLTRLLAIRVSNRSKLIKLLGYTFSALNQLGDQFFWETFPVNSRGDASRLDTESCSAY